jgi:hypothetical protein
MKSGPGMTGQWASRHVRDVSFWSPTSVQHVPRRPHPRPPPCCPFSKRAAQNSKQKEIDLLPLLVGFKPGSHVDPVGKGSTYIYTLSVCLFSENQTTGLGPLNWGYIYLFIYLFISILWCCSSCKFPISIFSQKISNIQNMKVENPKHAFHINENCG